MSNEFYPSTPAASSPPVMYVPTSRQSVWTIAAAVFVGNLLCALIGVALYFCLVFGMFAIAGAGNR